MMRKNLTSRLRHRFTLQQEMQYPDGAGGYTRSWQDVTDLWAEISPVSGREKFFAERMQAEITHKIVIRYRADVNIGMRFVYDNRVFNIFSVLSGREETDMLEILVKEIQL